MQVDTHGSSKSATTYFSESNELVDDFAKNYFFYILLINLSNLFILRTFFAVSN